jgi:hypothetical protein
METQEKIDQLIETKSWSDLSVDEKTFVVDVLGSEEQYHAMRDVHFALTNSAADGPGATDARILKNLKKKFRAKHSETTSFYAMRFGMPAYAAVLLLIVVGAGAWYAGLNSSAPVATSKIVYQTDTVLVASTPDTVYRDRVIYKTVHVATQPTLVAASTEKREEAEVGISMRETEPLQNLLVSGSE